MVQVTDVEKANIQSIWSKMMENLEKNGIDIFTRLFREYPETKKYFKNIPLEGNLQEDPLLRSHGRRVMVALNRIIQNLDNWKQVCKILNPLAEKHKIIHSVDVENFQFMLKCVGDVCQDYLGPCYTPEIAESFQKLQSSLYDQVVITYLHSGSD
ncbi:hemoglobin subunit alpha-D-like [Ornithorhynchus anatinus]|uniref:superoxide dismutase n=1 Tax=Ornithorhynchus anatinus TaxID=9258 RepID=A0A6I8NPV7_ORNAN|nr:hemoglobin subunit alpha-D-like [Ornithorhynchus anatinus]